MTLQSHTRRCVCIFVYLFLGSSALTCAEHWPLRPCLARCPPLQQLLARRSAWRQPARRQLVASACVLSAAAPGGVAWPLAAIGAAPRWARAAGPHLLLIVMSAQFQNWGLGEGQRARGELHCCNCLVNSCSRARLY